MFMMPVNAIGLASAARVRVVLVGLALALACGGGPAAVRATPAPVPAAVPLASTADAQGVASVCVGDAHGCALARDGRIACWGDNRDHQTSPDDAVQLDAPGWYRGFSSSRGLRCGPRATCSLGGAGQVECVGFRYHDSTRLYRAPEADAGSPVKIALPRPARDFMLDESGGCAILDDRSVSCWSDEDPEAPFAVPELKDAKAFAVASPASRVVCLTRAQGNPTCVRFAGRDPRDPLKGFPLQAAPLPALTGAAELLISGRLPESVCARGARARPDGVTCALLGGGKAAPDPLATVTPAAFLATNGTLSCFRDTAQAVRCVAGGGARAGAPPSLTGAVPADATALAMSAHHACALAKGRVACWGDASRGQLGDGTRFIHGPAAVPGIDDATAVAGGGGVVCAARKGDGKIACWGHASKNLTFDADGFANLAAPPGLSDLVIGQLGEPCGRIAGKASCWDGERWADRVRVEGKPDRGFAPAGSTLTADGGCAIDRKGRLGCAACPTCSARAAGVSWVPGTFVEAASASATGRAGRVACARSKDGRVACFRQAVDDVKLAPIDQPEIGALADVIKLTAASDDAQAAVDERASLTCAITRAGAVTCWSNGRLDPAGTGVVAAPPSPTALGVAKIEGLPPAVDVAVGGAFACAVTRDGRVFCWGSNRDGGAPDGTPRSRPTPAPIRLPSG